jgi:tetratricopeptide (TPR) repeat protein
MKPLTLVLAMVAAFGAACSSIDKPSAALRFEPVMSVRHGTENAQSYYRLGRYYQGQKRLEQAEGAYLKALAADDRHVDTLNALGSLYAERGELERSVQMFQRVTAMAPGAAYLYNNLGFAYYLLGQLDEAYAAVLKALNLDAKLERGWVNLEQIAGARSHAATLEAAKARQLDQLPRELAVNSPPDAAANQTLQITNEQSLSPKLELALEMPTKVVQADGDTPTPTKSADAPSVAVDTLEKGESQALLSDVRVEVSNGNGVVGFARKFSAQLRDNEIMVTRITNQRPYSVTKTDIHYDPRFEDAARTLMQQYKLTGRIVATQTPRARADIRIILGQDAL